MQMQIICVQFVLDVLCVLARVQCERCADDMCTMGSMCINSSCNR